MVSQREDDSSEEKQGNESVEEHPEGSGDGEKAKGEAVEASEKEGGETVGSEVRVSLLLSPWRYRALRSKDWAVRVLIDL